MLRFSGVCLLTIVLLASLCRNTNMEWKNATTVPGWKRGAQWPKFYCLREFFAETSESEPYLGICTAPGSPNSRRSEFERQGFLVHAWNFLNRWTTLVPQQDIWRCFCPDVLCIWNKDAPVWALLSCLRWLTVIFPYSGWQSSLYLRKTCLF